MIVKIVSPFNENVKKLIQQLNEHNLSYYSPDRCHLDSPEELAKDHCTLLGAYYGEELCGIGAVKMFDDYGEIKRMFVPQECRGRGISKVILNELCQIIKSNGAQVAKLETGRQFKNALKLYENSGFQYCEAFGPYEKAPVNTYMKKNLKE